ncbi:hypothetical protein BDV96DRAFT_634036 [Lophiotrema nucula]|uniref:BZIP domain-containing protein n=1 Tax=Lophiotrema nucula TaxID=690887 RepID=A0A6A5YZN9_9PLEO|nr:hypothetical protein BDV96DRAFT_634036 [Lophiotrema nucula]
MYTMDAVEWRDISDSKDRKKMQNRLAQRRKRERERTKKSEGSVQSRTISVDRDNATTELIELSPTQERSSDYPAPHELNFDFNVDTNFFGGDSVSTFDRPGNNPTATTDLNQTFELVPPRTPISPDIGWSPLPSLDESGNTSFQDAQQRISRLRRTVPSLETRLKDADNDDIRFSHIFKAMSAVGFSTFDQMAIRYYTAGFAPLSAAYDSQRQSRVRNLRCFLSEVTSATRSWGVRERRGWAEGIVHAAEEIHAAEVQDLLKKLKDGALRNNSTDMDDTAAQKAFFQEQLPDLWALFNRIVTASGLEQSHSSRIVLSALQALHERRHTSIETNDYRLRTRVIACIDLDIFTGKKKRVRPEPALLHTASVTLISNCAVRPIDLIQVPTITKTMEWTGEFATRPSNASEAAWESIYPRGGTFFSHTPEVPLRSTLSVFHQLHCLDAIRQAYFLAYDAAIAGKRLETAGIPEMTSEKHVTHCVELLRQSLMCASDRTVEVKNAVGGVTGFGTEHKCADYGALVSRIEVWKMEIGDDMEHQSGHTHHKHH